MAPGLCRNCESAVPRGLDAGSGTAEDVYSCEACGEVWRTPPRGGNPERTVITRGSEAARQVAHASRLAASAFAVEDGHDVIERADASIQRTQFEIATSLDRLTDARKAIARAPFTVSRYRH